MKFVFRLDFGPGTGWGHLSRCLNIASALRSRGFEVAIVTRSDSGSYRVFKNLLRSKSIKIITLPFSNSQHGLDISTSLETDREVADAIETVKIGNQLGADCVVLDHYGLGKKWVEIVRGNFEVCAIADYPVNFPVDTIIDYGFDASVEKHSQAVGAGAKVLAGPVFAPIGESYGRFSKPPEDKSNEVRRVLVSLGGFADPKLVLSVVRGLSGVLLNSNIYVTGDHTNLGELSLEFPGTRLTFAQEPDLASKFEEADLAIVSGGVTMYELIASGCLGLVLQTAVNQRFSLSSLAQLDHVKVVKNVSESRVAQDIVNLMSTSHRNKELRWLESRAIVDHIGPHRLALKLGGRASFQPVLRAVAPEDLPFLLRIANQPSSRAASPNFRTIQTEEHWVWGEGFLNGTRRGWIFGSSQVPIGHCRLEQEVSGLYLSYAIQEEFQGAGWGEAMLAQLFQQVPSSDKVFARVLLNNTASLRLLFRLGFSPVSEGGELVTLVREH